MLYIMGLMGMAKILEIAWWARSVHTFSVHWTNQNSTLHILLALFSCRTSAFTTIASTIIAVMEDDISVAVL
jgi:hypothetical protein